MYLGSEIKEVGVLGGTFNPVHLGHMDLAISAHDELGIQTILFMPVANTYYKDDTFLLDSKTRIEMLELSIKDYKDQYNIDYMSVSDLDCRRNKTTYTCDTIKELRRQYDKVDFIIGSDSLMYLDKWKDPDVFLKECTIVVAVRDDYSLIKINEKIESLIKEFGADIKLLKAEIRPFSSTFIRSRAREKKDFAGYLTPSVLKYITEKKLYEK